MGPASGSMWDKDLKQKNSGVYHCLNRTIQVLQFLVSQRHFGLLEHNPRSSRGTVIQLEHFDALSLRITPLGLGV